MSFLTLAPRFEVVRATDDYDWPMFGHDAAHTWTTLSSLQFPLQVDRVVNLTTLDSYPVVDGDSVFVSTSGNIQSREGGRVYSLHRNSGLVRWSHDLGGVINLSPAVSENRVFVPVSFIGAPQKGNASQPTSAAGEIVALDQLSGKLIWSRRTIRPIPASPAVVSGTLYVALDGEGIFALESATGTAKWFYPVPDVGSATASLIVYDGTVYVPLFGRGIFAFDAETGVLKWRFTPEGPRSAIESGLTAGSGLVFATADNLSAASDRWIVYLYAISAVTGQVVWKRLIYNFTYSPPELGVSGVVYPALSNKTLIITGNLGGTHLNSTGGVTALNAGTGRVIWSIADPVMDSIVVSDSSIIGLVWKNLLNTPTLAAFDLMTGRKVWGSPLPHTGAPYGPIVIDGSVLVAIWTGGLYRFASAAAISEFRFTIPWVLFISSAIVSLSLRISRQKLRNSNRPAFS
jgi:outer membrane protein assembly factor BamB